MIKKIVNMFYSRTILGIISVIAFSQFYITDAFAYIDPGTGSAIFAIVIGLITGIGMTIKIYWVKLKAKFSK